MLPSVLHVREGVIHSSFHAASLTLQAQAAAFSLQQLSSDFGGIATQTNDSEAVFTMNHMMCTAAVVAGTDAHCTITPNET